MTAFTDLKSAAYYRRFGGVALVAAPQLRAQALDNVPNLSALSTFACGLTAAATATAALA